MELGNEIGQKIRSAIKAKLVDLGAYVDDELPDYVMVMVANKKTQNQMIDDLNLFLGNNTAKFTSWLHGLLEKLLSITLVEEEKRLFTESDGAKDGLRDILKIGSKDGTIKGLNKLTFVKETTKSRSGHLDDNQKDSSKVDMKKTIGEKRKADTNKDHSSKNSLDVSDKNRMEVCNENDAQVVRINAELNEFDDEGNTIEDVSKIKRKKFEGTDLSDTKKTIVSKVGSIINKSNKDEELKQSSTSLASIVKVTERKSSVPEGMQPSKVLLMKAMQQAERSVTLIKEKLNYEKSKEIKESDLSSRLTNRQKDKKIDNTLKSRHSDSKKRCSRERSVDLKKQKHSTNLRQRSRSRSINRIKKSSTTEHVASKTDNRALQNNKENMVTEKIIGRSNKSIANEEARNILSTSKNDHSELNTSTESEANNMTELDKKKDSDVEITGTEIKEVRRVRCIEVDGGVQAKQRTVMLMSKQDANDDDDDDEDTDEDILRVGPRRQIVSKEAVRRDEETEDANQLRKLLMKQKKSKTNPRFIVTMNSDLDNPVVEEEDAVVIAMNESQMLEYVTGHSVDVNKEIVVIDDEDDGWRNEQCKFWPSCKNGDSCPYQHPTTNQCKTFPNCRFGDKCKFMHPPCKFASACTNAHCAFLHTMPRHILAPNVPSIHDIKYGLPHVNGQKNKVHKNVCKFYPNCSDMDCRFLHPKPCRFGLGCTQKNACSFSHPVVPPKNMLKWTAKPNLLG